MHVGEKVRNRFYITAILCLHLLLIYQRKILFYKKIICGSNVVLRTVCSLYFNEIQRLSSKL